MRVNSVAGIRDTKPKACRCGGLPSLPAQVTEPRVVQDGERTARDRPVHLVCVDLVHKIRRKSEVAALPAQHQPRRRRAGRNRAVGLLEKQSAPGKLAKVPYIPDAFRHL